MSRSRAPSLTLPLLFVSVAAGAALLMGQAWWQQRQASLSVAPASTVTPPIRTAASAPASLLPARPAVGAPAEPAAASPSLAAPAPASAASLTAGAEVPAAAASGSTPAPDASPQVQKCIGADGVPIYTSQACPEGSALEKRIAVEIARDAAAAPHAYVAGAPMPQAPMYPASPLPPSYDPYYIPPRALRSEIDAERSWDRCEQAKMDERLEIDRLGNDRTMSDIRRLEKRTQNICAEYRMRTER